MSISTGIWLVILAAVVVVYSIYFFGETRPVHRTVRDRLRGVILPSIEFQAGSLAEAAARLTELSQTYDSSGDGVLFRVVADPEHGRTDGPILISFNKTSLWDALEQVALLYQLTYHIDGAAYTVSFQTCPQPPALLERCYSLPPERFPTPWACNDYMAYFRGFGLMLSDNEFQNSHIEYDPQRHTLKVSSSENTLNLIEKMFDLDPDKDSEN